MALFVSLDPAIPAHMRAGAVLSDVGEDLMTIKDKSRSILMFVIGIDPWHHRSVDTTLLVELFA